MGGFKIGELSQLTGIPTGTIRFYERQGLISPPPRTASGYRQYSTEALYRLQMVRQMREFGFSLGEIGELMALFDKDNHLCQGQHCLAAAKLRELDGRITELQDIKNNLQAMLQHHENGVHKCKLLSAIALASGMAAQLMIAGNGTT